MKGRKYLIKAMTLFIELKDTVKLMSILKTDLLPNVSVDGPFDDEKNPSKIQCWMWYVNAINMRCSQIEEDTSIDYFEEIDSLLSEVMT